MSSDRHGLFQQLEPPAGGAERFRRRLDEAVEGGRWPRRWSVAASSAAAVVAVAAAVVLLDADRRSESALSDSVRARPPDPVVPSLYEAPQFDRLLGRPLTSTEPSVTLNDRAAKVAEIRTASENVRIYRLE